MIKWFDSGCAACSQRNRAEPFGALAAGANVAAIGLGGGRDFQSYRCRVRPLVFRAWDKQAQVRCVMFRSRAMALISVRRKACRSSCALRRRCTGARRIPAECRFHAPRGTGALFEQFERLKARLAAEALFASERKRGHCRHFRAGSALSPPAAAALVCDVLTTLRRRMPGIEVVLYPTPVQGRGAALQIAQALPRPVSAPRSSC